MRFSPSASRRSRRFALFNLAGKPFLCAGLVAFMGTSQPLQAELADATIPSGYISVRVDGTGGTKPYQLTFLGVSLLHPVASTGVVANSTANFITNNASLWTANQFNGTNGRFFVEITSGANTGQMTEITDTSADTITTADTLPALTAGTTFRIRKQRTLSDVFGAPPAALQGGTASTADEVFIYGPDGNFVSYYYKTSGLGGMGWRKAGDAATDRAQEPLWITEGVLIRRKQATDSSLLILGDVKTGATAIVIEPGTNFVANLAPISGGLTFSSSGLYNPSAPSQSLTGGSSSTADTVQIYNPANSSYTSYYYKTSGLGGTGWRAVGDAATDASNVSIPPSAAVIIQRKNGAAFLWSAPAAYTRN